MDALDEMATAARAGDAERYRAALSGDQDLTEEQQTDAYQPRRPPGACSPPRTPLVEVLYIEQGQDQDEAADAA